MYLSAARDTAATFFLADALSRVREEHMERALAGDPPDDGFWEDREEAVMEALKRRYYTASVRDVVKPDDGEMSDDDDFASRDQELTERAIWLTHERLKAIPFVGQEKKVAD